MHTKVYYLTVLSGNIFSKRDNYYSLRGHEVAAIRRHKSRFMKDSLAYRGSILWNLVNFNEKITNVSFKKLKKRLTARDYFKDFIFGGTAVSKPRHRISDYVYFKFLVFIEHFTCIYFGDVVSIHEPTSL